MNAVHLARIDLNLLVVLHELLRARSTTEVARRLGRTQSAISHALARLRDTFHDPLFVRAGARLTPTARAEELAGPLAQLMASTDALLRDTSDTFDPARVERTFSIGTTDFSEILLLPALLPRLRREAPGIDLRTVFLGAELDRAIQTREIDLAIGALFRDLTGLLEQTLYEDRLVCVVRRGHPKARRRFDLETFVALDHALVAPRGLPGSTVDAALAPLGLRRRVVLTLPHFAAAALVVAETDLVLTVPERFARWMAARAPLTVFDPPLALPGFRFSMLFSSTVRDDPAHAWMRRVIAESFRSKTAPAPAKKMSSG
jgi:DNA-binding transcriptional LysR family regulator